MTSDRKNEYILNDYVNAEHESRDISSRGKLVFY